MGLFRGSKTEMERLGCRVAELEAKLGMVLQLTAIRIADPALYSKVIETVVRWKDEPEGKQDPEKPVDGSDAGDAMGQLANMMAYSGREQPEGETGRRE